MIFFFQAEDGIRDGHVTGVQTCALPICPIQNIWKIDSRYAGSILFGLKNQFYVDETIRSMVQLKFKRMGNVIRWKKGFGSLFADVIFNNKKYSPMSMIQNPMKYLKKSDMVSLVV